MKKTLSILLTVCVAVSGVMLCTSETYAASRVGRPGKVNVSNKTENLITLKWGKVKGAKGYAVFRNGKEIAKVKGTTVTDSGLKASTTYKYTVKAYKTKTKYYNSKKHKWQKKKPKKWKGKKKTTFTYGKASPVKKVTTAKSTANISWPSLETARKDMIAAANRYVDAFIGSSIFAPTKRRFDVIVEDEGLDAWAQSLAEQMAKTGKTCQYLPKYDEYKPYGWDPNVSMPSFCFAKKVTKFDDALLAKMDDDFINRSYGPWDWYDNYKMGVGYCKGYLCILGI